MRIFALALLICLITAAISIAATEYWAFGDSITRGEGEGFILDPVGGNDCTAVPYPVVKCGYHWRLENALALAGIPNNVTNRGLAGESTATGKSRIDDPGEPLATSRCTDPDAGDVLLVMEGTNDINGLSNATIKANLRAMLDLATTKCVHSAVASTIRLLLAGTPIGSKTGDPLHPQVSDLATQVSSLAGEENRAYVDVWTSLCPNQACYNSNYWGRLVLADPGHVSFDGYDVMAPIFETVITAVPLPGAAGLIAPSGDGSDSTPEFSWNEHPNSDWYFLEVDGGASYGRWHPEEDICAGGVCSFDPGSALADGDHTWRVRTRNLRGVGSWSATSSFGVWTAPPAASVPGYPDTNIFDTTPIYQWNEVANATEYDLEVDVNLIQETFQATDVCSGGLCSATPTLALAVGTHSWRVRTRNPFSNGPWSGANTFDVLACSPVTNDLPGATVGGMLMESACEEIIAGSLGNYTIQGPAGDVTFHAGDKITIHNGFTVEQNAKFTAIVDK